MGLYPVEHLVVVAALMMDVEVELQTCWPVGGIFCENGCDVGVAHEAEAKRLDAVVDVHATSKLIGEEPGVSMPALVEHLERPGCLADKALATTG